MGDAIFCREEIAVEYFASVAASEMAGFGNWMEDLEGGSAVDREVVDRFMGYWVVGNVGGCWEHGDNGSGVGSCEGFTLRLGGSANCTSLRYEKSKIEPVRMLSESCNFI